MFYGQDVQRGAPPPLVFLRGLGEYQFNNHPCVVASININLPDNVDYIRARSAAINGTNLLSRRSTSSVPSNPLSSAWARINALFGGQGVQTGSTTNRPAPPSLGLNSSTYVPTRIDLSIQLLPVQTRSQISQQFSLKSFANGDLLKGGFW